MDEIETLSESNGEMSAQTLPAELVERVVEAALFASNQPLTRAQLSGLFGEDAEGIDAAVDRAIDALMQRNDQRGVALIEVASGYRYQVHTDLQPWVARLWAEKPPRYSRALLETLALIAYRQPITRGEIEQIRGVAVSSHIIKTLEEREWIRVVGHRDVPGRPALFGTTRGFLDYFSLRSLDQLPPLTELQDLPELEPELPLESGQTAAVKDAEAAPEALPSPSSDNPQTPETAESDSEIELASDTGADNGFAAAEIDADVDSDREPATPDEPAAEASVGEETADTASAENSESAHVTPDSTEDPVPSDPQSVDEADAPQEAPQSGAPELKS